jgi:hypothetical protein
MVCGDQRGLRSTNIVTRMAMMRVVCATLVLSGPTSLQSALAGNLNRCDQARIAGHNTILNKYREVESHLDATAARASSVGSDPMKLSFDATDSRSHFPDISALKVSLQRQEASDAGDADRKIAVECRDAGTTIEDLIKIADNIAALGISTVLPGYAPDRGFSETTDARSDLRPGQPPSPAGHEP